ncbi:MAG TPA: cyclopropane-fatty-acyl-phospholipid synthase family protein [Thermoleophilaceae bacterium]
MIAPRLVHALLGRVRGGRIEVVDGGVRRGFGPRDAELRAEITVRDPAFWRALRRGSSGLGESYAEGLWDCDDLVSLVRIAARELPRLDWLRALFAPLRNAFTRVPSNTRARAREHAAAHYDLGNELFALFLDETMTYSCAVFDTPETSLLEAQRAKLDMVCRKLELEPADHLVEIGTGWGSLALHAAGEYGCRVTTTTLSRRQHAVATARVREAGLHDRVDVLLEDYRDLRGRYSKLASIEMIEAVGWQHFDTFFACCSRLLERDGLMLLQAITIDDRAYEIEKSARSFSNDVIFPGGCLPSAAEIRRATAAATDMRILDIDDITAGYPVTLRHWRENWVAAAGEARRLGADRRFIRLFEFYFAWCEGGFTERRIGDVQALLAKPAYRGSRENIRRETLSSSAAGPREASFASASLPPGPST